MPHMAVRRPFAERDLGHQLRLHPALAAGGAPAPAAGLDGRCIEQRLVDLELDQSRMHGVAGARIPARADVARIEERALVVVAQQEAAHLGGRVGAVGEAADHQLLAQRALELQPGLGARRHVGRIATLQDDPFELHLAGGLEHLRRRGIEGLAEANALALVRVDDRAQHRAARQQRNLAEIAALVERQVEDEEDDVAAGSVVHGVLQGVEIGNARRAEDHDLAVEPGWPDRQRRDLCSQRRHLRRPVVAAAREELALAVLDARHQAIAVELGLDDPVALRRRRRERRQLRRELGRQAARHSRRQVGGRQGRACPSLRRSP